MERKEWERTKFGEVGKAGGGSRENKGERDRGKKIKERARDRRRLGVRGRDGWRK